MAEKSIPVEITDGNGNYAELKLPATDYELLDVQERMDGTALKAEILDYSNCEYLIRMHDQVPLNQLNVLMQRLSNFTEAQEEAFKGLIAMDYQKSPSIRVERMINLAFSTDCCHVVAEAQTDEELGRFYVDNGFYPQLDDLPEVLYDMLDYESLGRKSRVEEGGVFTDAGYIVQDGELMDVSRRMDFQPHKPEYVFRLQIRSGADDVFTLDLPVEENIWQNTLREHGIPGTNRGEILGCDGPIQNLILQNQLEAEISTLNELGQKLIQLEKENHVVKLKIIQAAVDAKLPTEILDLADHLEDYAVEPKVKSVEEFGASDLEFSLGRDEFERLRPYVNLVGYGQAAMEYQNAVITPYGVIQRQDGEPILSVEQELKREEGMVFT